MLKQAQSLLDYLLQVMPELKDQKFRIMLRQQANDPNAKKLYNLWSDASNHITDRKFKRPPTMSENDVKSLERSGLIEVHGKDLKVTSQGTVVLRKLILDDDTFYLDKSACTNCRRKTASVIEKNTSSWYKRYKDDNVIA